MFVNDQRQCAIRLRIAFLFFTFAVSGCGSVEPDGYDPDLQYPSRSDPLFITAPPESPVALSPPGRLDESLVSLNSIGGRTFDPNSLSLDERAILNQSLLEMFGTPASPSLPPTLFIDSLDCTAARLAQGSRLYRRLCTQCHGLSGDGRGPGGPWLNPLPRDFRMGSFKCSSAGTGTGKPSIDDLRRVIRAGVKGTAMQSFDSLPASDLDSLIAYVIHLSVRGEVEFRVLREFRPDGEPTDAATELERVCKQWAASQQEVKLPRSSVPSDLPDADSIRRGEKLFARIGCAACHVDFGRADQFRYDVWGFPNRVADLTEGKYRWGGSAADIARRVRHGIPAANMPANPGLTVEEVRDLSGFVRALPVPDRLPDDVRSRIYK